GKLRSKAFEIASALRVVNVPSLTQSFQRERIEKHFWWHRCNSFARPSCGSAVCWLIPKDDPEAALEAQIEKYRQMTGEQRLRLALELHEFSCNVAREGIR